MGDVLNPLNLFIEEERMSEERRDCPACEGTGDCRNCEGKGYTINSANAVLSLGIAAREDCPRCDATGQCTRCDGKGHIPVD